METTDPRFDTLSRTFFDADYAREFLEAVRWPDGPVCPHCGVEGEAYKLAPKKPSKRSARPGLYKCAVCRKQFTVTVGTIFEGTRGPLSKWLYAIHLMAASKKGIAAHQLHRTLKVQYKTAWFMNHRIRKAMEAEPLASLLSGVVEADETFIGGKGSGESGGPTAGGSKAILFTLVERGGNSRSEVVPDVTADTQDRHPGRGGPGHSHDDRHARSCSGPDQDFASHETVNHSAGEYVRGDVHINTTESRFSLFKRGVFGVFHHISTTHLFRYASEFGFGWNHRDTTDGERLVAAIQATGGKRLFYRTPKAPPWRYRPHMLRSYLRSLKSMQTDLRQRPGAKELESAQRTA